MCLCVCSCTCYIVRTNRSISLVQWGDFWVSEDILSGQVSERPYKGSSTRFCLHVSVSAFLIGSCVFRREDQNTPLGSDSNVQGHLPCLQPCTIRPVLLFPHRLVSLPLPAHCLGSSTIPQRKCQENVTFTLLQETLAAIWRLRLCLRFC